MNGATDTIAAIATPAGNGGVGIVRLSGPQALAIAKKIGRRSLRPRYLHYGAFFGTHGEIMDRGCMVHFPAPRSFTGEDVIELHAHGGSVVLNEILHACLDLGARSAEAGEFSQRAFLNGRIDLVQAEAIADLIAAGSEAQAKAAQRSLAGEFSKQVRGLLERLVQIRTFVESAIDFPDEEIEFLQSAQILERLVALQADLAALLDNAKRGQRLRDGLHLVIVGKPNAGKSSLLNRLLGHERAIVTDIAGTTRDLIKENLDIAGAAYTIVDTAGLRQAQDQVEAEGVKRAKNEMAIADLALIVLDADDEQAMRDLQAELPAALRKLWIHNKIDQSGMPPKRETRNGDTNEPETHLWISALTGAGMDLLTAELTCIAGGGDAAQGAFSARTRHVRALEAVMVHIDEAIAAIADARGTEWVAEELRHAQQNLSEITGAFSTEQLLASIFSSFCIGK